MCCNKQQCVIIVLLHLIAIYAEVVHDGARQDYAVKKRGDADVPKCIKKFDIHKDKIIRTTDSRAMGAKYLNEMDLDTREECLRLCCETENCDVFVYEEKNAGSCYLFQCGPPEDFKCKFTHHVNYTSAINRHLLDLESQIKLTKPEQELTKLRNTVASLTGNNAPTIGPQSMSKPTISPTVNNNHVESIHTEPAMIISENKCSMNQFECRSTKECIAIYNACDGIPQCADGSDEGPDLLCPDRTTLPPFVPPKNQKNPPENVETKQTNLVPTNSEVYKQHGLEQNVAKMPQIENRPADFLRPPLNPMAGMQQYDVQQSQYPYLSPGQSNWGHSYQQHMQAQNAEQYPNSMQDTHIFNHKGSGLQLSDKTDSRQVDYGHVGGNQRIPNYNPVDVYGPQLPESYWANNKPAEYRGNAMYPNKDMNPIENPWKQASKNEANRMIYNKPAQREMTPIMDNSEVIGQQEQEKVASDLKNSKYIAPKIAETQYPAAKNEKHAEHANKHPAEPEKYITQYKIELDGLEDVEDGITETPSGAVISLTLGLILTAFMGLFIACRLRVVKRRIRRNGKSYAHDADYLVNGMYL